MKNSFRTHFLQYCLLAILASVHGVADALIYNETRIVDWGTSQDESSLDFGYNIKIVTPPTWGYGTVVDLGPGMTGSRWRYSLGAEPAGAHRRSEDYAIQTCNSSGNKCGNANGLSDYNFKITFGTSNQPPSISISPAPMTINEGDLDGPMITVSDPDGDPVTLQYAQHHYAANAWPTTGSGKYIVQDSIFGGSDAVVVRACDDQGACSSYVRATITITSLNEPPTASDITIHTKEGRWSLPVKVNSYDEEGDPMHIVVVSPPLHGTTHLYTDPEKITYKPDYRFNGTDSFTYKVCDTAGACSPVYTATVLVDGNNDPPSATNINIVTNEDVWSSWTNTSPTDPEGDPVTIEILSMPASGTAEVSGTTVRYLGNQDFFGSDQFTFRACDDGGLCSPSYTANITVNPVNDAPTIQPISLTGPEDIPTAPAYVVVADIENDTLSWSIKVAPDSSAGVLERRTDQSGKESIRFVPAPDWSGTESAILEVCETSTPERLCSEGIVAIEIAPHNDPPVVNDVFLFTTEDNASSWVDVNASDPEGDPLTYMIDNAKAVGGIGQLDTKRRPPQVRYMPRANWNGMDSFEITVCDDKPSCTTAVAHIEVTAVNDAPILGDVYITTEEDTASEPYQLQATDADPTDTVTYSLKTQPPVAEGVATLSGDTLSFMPAVDWSGTSTFEVEACDDNTTEVPGTPACVVAVVNVTVTPRNDPPTVTMDPLVTDEDVAVTGTPVITDPDPGDTHMLVVVTSPPNGTVSIDNTPGANHIVYTPARNYFGQDAMEINVCDQSGECSLLRVSVDVNPVNDAPTDAQLSMVVKKGVQSGWMEPIVLDPDPEQSFSFSIVDSGQDLIAQTDPAGTRISVLPKAGYVGDTSFTFKVCDQDLACTTATASVKVLDDLFHKNGKDASAQIALVSGGYPKSSENEYPATSQKVIRATGTAEILQGTYDLEITWNTARSVDLDVSGQVIRPNTTGMVTGYDFTSNNGTVSLPVKFTGYVPPGPVGELFIRVIDPETGSEDSLVPNIRIPIAAWDVNEAVVISVTDVADPAGSVAKMVEKATIKASLNGTYECGAGLFAWNPLYVSSYYGLQACGVQWTRIPEGMDTDTLGVHPSITGRFVDPSRPSVATVGWIAGLIQTNGSKAEFLPALNPPSDFVIALYEPKAPTIEFIPDSRLASKKTWVPSGYWPATVGADKFAGHILGSTDFDGITIDMTSGGNTRTQASPGGKVSSAVLTNIASTGATESFNATASYLYDPSLSSTLNLNFMATPSQPTLFVNRLTEALSGDTLQVTGVVGIYNSATGNIDYDPAQVGNWRVRLYRYDPETKDDVLVSGPQPIEAATGQFSLPIDVQTSYGSRMNLHVEASLVTGGVENRDAVIKSSIMNVVIHNTSPVGITMDVDRETGAAPFLAFPYARFDDLRRFGDVSKILWEYSLDGVTFQPVPDIKERAPRIAMRLENPEERWFRATTVNKYSGARATSNVVKVKAYRAPKVEISGYTKTFIDHPVTWTARNVLGDPTDYVWEVYKDTIHSDPIFTETGDTLVLPATETGRYYVKVTATPTESSEVEASKKVLTKSLDVRVPYLRRPIVLGPKYAEVGHTYHFEAINSPIIYGSETDLQIDEEWELPNGVILSGNTVDYTIQPGDNSVRYHAWVVGYKAETLVEVKKTFYPWAYEWPTKWIFSGQKAEYIAPARAILYVKTDPPMDIRKMGLEKPTYTFTIPAEVSLVWKGDNKLVVDLPMPGSYPIEAIIEDSRGNQEIVTVTLTAIDPPPLKTEVKIGVSDRWNRAPSYLTTRVNILNPISGERTQNHKVYFDGKLISDKSDIYVDRFEVTDVGTHEIVSELTLTSGRSAISSSQFTLIEGELPNCTVGYTVYATSTTAQLRCTTDMGYVKRMEWYAQFQDTGQEEKLGMMGFYGLFHENIRNRGITSLRILVFNDKGQMVEVNSAFPE